MRHEFKIGDRVVGNGKHCSLEKGVTGTVIEHSENFNRLLKDTNLSVQWDDGRRDQGWHHTHMELLRKERPIEDPRDYLTAITEFQWPTKPKNS